MLVTLSSKGAAVARIELSSSRYHDLEDRSGYLGHIVVDETIRDKNFKGCPVQVVGAGTPAAEAGLKAGDIITAVDGQVVKGAASLHGVLSKTKPKQADRNDGRPRRRGTDAHRPRSPAARWKWSAPTWRPMPTPPIRSRCG